MGQSLLPGLLGLTALENRRSILDLVNNHLHFLGPGDFDLLQALPAGTESFQLKHAPSGHLLLPCNKFEAFDKQQANGTLTMDQTPLNLVASSSSGDPRPRPDSRPNSEASSDGPPPLVCSSGDERPPTLLESSSEEYLTNQFTRR